MEGDVMYYLLINGKLHDKPVHIPYCITPDRVPVTFNTEAEAKAEASRQIEMRTLIASVEVLHSVSEADKIDREVKVRWSNESSY